MLRISLIDSHTRRGLVLEGTLTSPWIAELKIAWERAYAGALGRDLFLDLKNVTYISANDDNRPQRLEVDRPTKTASCILICVEPFNYRLKTCRRKQGGETKLTATADCRRGRDNLLPWIRTIIVEHG